MRKALDQQKKAEAQLGVETERCVSACVCSHTLLASPLVTCPRVLNRVAGLQQEVSSLRAKLKGAKEKAKSYEGQVVGIASLRAEHEQQQQAVRSELRSVKAEVREGLSASS